MVTEAAAAPLKGPIWLHVRHWHYYKPELHVRHNVIANCRDPGINDSIIMTKMPEMI